MEICKMLTLSIRHVSPETMLFLEEAVESGEVACYEKEGYGFWLFCGVTCIGSHIPGDLISLMDLARECDCLWLQLDADGPIEESIPTYERR